VARGAAIVAMIAYHFGWDLSFLQLAPIRVVGDPVWNVFARSIAGSFLALAGFGLCLAHGRTFRARPFLIRLARIGAAALAVTIATYFAFPESYIFFGILHAIAVCSVLALPFLRLPAWVTGAAAVLCLVAPRLLTNPALDHPLLDWLGLGAQEPLTNDYVPVLPWLGPVLMGVAAGRIVLRDRSPPAFARWRAAGPITGALAWAGRRSLPIYLVHQPLLLAALTGVLQIVGPHPQAQAQAFLRQCTADCVEANGNVGLCRTACACVVDRLAEGGGFTRRGAPADQARISAVAQACLRGDRPGAERPDPVPGR
jgi:uncharacterized membrane protein